MRNNKPTQDTFTAAQAEVADRILASPLAQYIHPSTKDSLRRIAAGEGRPGAWNFINVEFRRAGSNCSLSINVESDSYRSEYEQDEAGNDYDRMRILPPQLSWPSHGSQDVGTCFAWVEFYKDVCRVAADIQAEFVGSPRYWRLTRTREQREEQAAKAAAEKVKNAVASALDVVAGGARVGGTPKSMPIELLKDVPDGSYDHEFGDERGRKKFHLEVKREGEVVIGLWVRTV